MSNHHVNSAPLDVYESYQNSVTEGKEDWKQWISENIVFSSPLIKLTGKKAFINFHEIRYKALIKRQLERIATCDDYVVTVSSITFRKPNQETFTVKATEWYTIQNGKIKSLESFGDASGLQDKPINIFSHL